MSKKESFVFIFIMAVIILLMVFLDPNQKPKQAKNQLVLEIINYTIQGKTFVVYLADTPEKITQGLSGIKFLDIDGMLLIFDKPYKTSFWNKDTHLDLELWWIRADSVIKKDRLPSVDKAGILTVQAPIEVDKVLELVIK